MLGTKASFDSVNRMVHVKMLLQGQAKVEASAMNIDIDNDGKNDLIAYFVLIKFIVAARELAGLDPELAISKYYGSSAPGLPYFLIYFGNP